MNEQEKDDEKLSDLSYILTTPQGRRYLWGKLGDYRIFQLSFDKDNSRKSDFNEGMRNAALMLQDEIISIMPDFYAIMAKEIR